MDEGRDGRARELGEKGGERMDERRDEGRGELAPQYKNQTWPMGSIVAVR